MINGKTNMEIIKEFDKSVIGHQEAKRTLISQVNRSKISFYQKYLDVDISLKNELERMNVMLIGPSGTGKTHLVRTLQKLVDFPLVMLDATRLEPNGGARSFDSKAVLQMIEDNAKELTDDPTKPYYSVEGTIDQTVVFIDEIDKLAKPFESTGNWNNQIQAGLLSVLESGERYSKVSFILAGAFADLDKKASVSKSMGFTKEDPKEEELIINDEDVIKYGLMPELIGRIDNIVTLDVLDYDTMNTILNTLLLPAKLEHIKFFGIDGSALITEEQKHNMIEKAMASCQGVRLLKRELNKIFNDAEFIYEETRPKLLPCIKEPE